MHIKNVKILAVVIILLFAMTGCNAKKQTPEQKLIEETQNSELPIIKEKELNEANTEFEAIESADGKDAVHSIINFKEIDAVPGGILCRESDMLVADRKNDRILVVSYDGILLKTIGQTGNAPLEFQQPMGITEFEDTIYILDGINNRVQLLNENLEFLESFSILEISYDPEFTMKDIAVDKDGTIFLSYSDLHNPGILYKRKSEKIFTQMKQNYCGYLASYQGEVYGINSGRLYLPKDTQGTTGMGLGMGDNYLFKITPDSIEKVVELPRGSYLMDFEMGPDYIRGISGTYHKVLQFSSKNGSLEKSLGSMEVKASADAYIACSMQGNYYLSNGLNKDIYVIEGTDDE